MANRFCVSTFSKGFNLKIMRRTYFKIELNDVKNIHSGNKTTLDLTNHSNKENFFAEFAENLDCEEDELDFENSWFSADEDFLLEILKLNSAEDIEDETFDNISIIENSGVSLDIIEATSGVLSSSDSIDTIVDHAKENYIGSFNSEADFADYYCEHYEEVEIPNILQGCIDWQRVWDSSLRHNHSEHNGHYFRD